MNTLRKAVVALATLVAIPALVTVTPSAATPTTPAAATTTPATTTPATTTSTIPAAEGVGCSSTRVCTPLNGGAYFTTTRNGCTAGLPVRTRAGQWYVLTAGHCVANAKGKVWKQNGLTLGTGTRWEYGKLGTEKAKGTSDLGLIKVTANTRTWNARSRVLVAAGKLSSQKITGVKNARNGEKVCVTAGRTGSTKCGTVVSTNTSLTYASPGLAARTVSNLALVKGICLNPGDSGSPVFAGRAAVGIAVARSASGCYAWYAKIPTKLAQYGLTVG